ncbi:MAG: hypothetical protein IPK31_14090 [Chitinophagaceae bacterium]|nr:hypothetical protein [Chitinophagaceae bacterium]
MYGNKLTANEVSLPKNTKTNPLNLGGFAAPPFPKSVYDCIAMEPVKSVYGQQLKEQVVTLGGRLKAVAAKLHLNQPYFLTEQYDISCFSGIVTSLK